MDGLSWKPLLKWMIWGVPLFLETPICFICPPREKQVDTNTTNLHHSIYIHIVWKFESLGFWMPETDASITAYSAYSGLPCLHLDWISTIGGLFASKPNRYPQSVCHLFVSEVSRCGRIPVCCMPTNYKVFVYWFYQHGIFVFQLYLLI